MNNRKNRLMLKNKKERAITLIALVVTIIVLLIITGVSIVALTGENGLIKQANSVKGETELAWEKEVVEKATVEAMGKGEYGEIEEADLRESVENRTGKGKVDVYGINSRFSVFFIDSQREYIIDNKGNVSLIKELPYTEETTPPLIDGYAEVIEGTTLETGLVIKDSNDNEWVWIEVQKRITRGCTTDEQIEAALQNYAKSYRNENYSDTWSSLHGLTESEYNANKSSMLQDIAFFGGFYIGRYEVGIEEGSQLRDYNGDPYVGAHNQGANLNSDINQNPVIQKNRYPYNYLKCAQAQELAEKLSTPWAQSGLMYGIQWDLILKYLEFKSGKSVDEIKEMCRTKGNFYSNNFTLNEGSYSKTNGQSWTVAPYEKKFGENVLITTGSVEEHSFMNIYDLAGNLGEWTLELNRYDETVARNGIDGTYNYISYTFSDKGFRPTLY